MKKFICGLLCGAVLCTAIGVFAVNSIYENPYRITVNGAEKQIQGYNIDDYSYFKLRDIADAVGGFNVNFDNDTIVLNTNNEKVSVPTSTPNNNVSVPAPKSTPNPKLLVDYAPEYFETDWLELTSDGIPLAVSVSNSSCVWEDGNKYVSKGDIRKVYDVKAHGYKFGTNCIMDDQYNKIIDNFVLSSDGYSIELNYYETVLRPWLQEHCN